MAKIEIKENGSKEFYTEVVNVTGQYGRLLRNPEAKLKDNLKAFKGYIIISIILLLVFTGEIILGNESLITWILIALFIFIGLSSFLLLYAYNKQLKVMLNDNHNAEFVIDDEGIELVKPSLTVKLSWDNIAFARVFKNSVCFLPKKQTGMIIAIERKYYDEISQYIKTQTIIGRD